jgi:hypothetical protein
LKYGAAAARAAAHVAVNKADSQVELELMLERLFV